MSKRFLFKKLKKWEISLLTYLEKKNCRRQSEFLGFIRATQRVQSERCYEKYTGGDRSSVLIYFGTILFIWLNPLVPSLSNSISGKTLGIKDERRPLLV